MPLALQQDHQPKAAAFSPPDVRARPRQEHGLGASSRRNSRGKGPLVSGIRPCALTPAPDTRSCVAPTQANGCGEKKNLEQAAECKGLSSEEEMRGKGWG